MSGNRGTGLISGLESETHILDAVVLAAFELIFKRLGGVETRIVSVKTRAEVSSFVFLHQI